MKSPETHDPIDKLLREQDTHVPDDGFTKRVITALPRRRQPILSRIILFTVVIAGTAAVVHWMPWKNLPPLDYTQVGGADMKVLSAWLPFVVVIVVLASAAIAAAQREE
jgi:hypothetical protein